MSLSSLRARVLAPMNGCTETHLAFHSCLPPSLTVTFSQLIMWIHFGSALKCCLKDYFGSRRRTKYAVAIGECSCHSWTDWASKSSLDVNQLTCLFDFDSFSGFICFEWLQVRHPFFFSWLFGTFDFYIVYFSANRQTPRPMIFTCAL